MPRKIVLKKGLYTNEKGNTVVYVINDVHQGNLPYVEFDNIRTGKEYDWPLEDFEKRYPNRVDKIEVSFQD